MSKATMFINAHIELDNGDRYEAKIPKSRLDNVIKNMVLALKECIS